MKKNKKKKTTKNQHLTASTIERTNERIQGAGVALSAADALRSDPEALARVQYRQSRTWPRPTATRAASSRRAGRACGTGKLPSTVTPGGSSSREPRRPVGHPGGVFFLSFFLSFFSFFEFFVVYFQAPAVRCATKRDEQQTGQQQHDEQLSSSIA